MLQYQNSLELISIFQCCITRIKGENMSVKCIPHQTPLYVEKLGFAGVYQFFLIFDPKHALCVLIRTAVLTCTHNVCFELKYK